MSLLLDNDNNTAAQAHVDELSRRVTTLFLVVSLFSILWFTRVDGLLTVLMSHLAPCQGDCLNIYEPAQWSVVRWMGAILLGTLTSLPIVAFNAYSFARPGLMITERRALKRWLIGTIMLTFVGVAGLVGYILPQGYEAGYMHHVGIGLEAQYSAVQLLSFAGYAIASWMTFVLVISTTVCLGLLGWLTKETAGIWRLRIYGVATLLIVASAPESGRSAVLPILGFTVGVNEILGQRWWGLVSNLDGKIVETFDGMGARRRLGVIDCSCNGANPFGGHMSGRKEASIRVDSLCRHVMEREQVLQFAMVSNLTDLVVTGCDTTPCPSSFKENLNSLRCSFNGMNLMQLSSHRGDPSFVHPYDLDGALMLAAPGNDHRQNHARLDQAATHQNITLRSLMKEQWDGTLSPILISDSDAIALIPS